MCSVVFPRLHAAAAEPAVRFTVNFEELPNLTYQLDCVTGHATCHAADFRALWDREFLRSDDDRKQLAEWKAARDRYVTTYQLPSDGETFPIEPPHASVDVSQRIAVAGLQARSLSDYLTRLDLLVLPRDRAVFEQVVRCFEPRFAVWWNRSRAHGAAFARSSRRLLTTKPIAALIEQFVAFYRPHILGGDAVEFDLLLRPGFVKDAFRAQAIDRHLAVEFLPEEPPTDRIDVALHEFCHFLFASRTARQEAELQGHLGKQPHDRVLPAFNLLDEALATALGNGVVRRALITPERWQAYLATDQSFYARAHIDRAAKAMLPIVDDWLARGATLDEPEFAVRYVKTLSDAFGDQLGAPAIQLLHSYVFVDERFPVDVVYDANATFAMASMASDHGTLDKLDLAQYESLPNTNALFIVPPEALDLLAARKLVTPDELSQIKRARRPGGWLFARQRTRNAYTYVVVASTEDAAKLQLAALARLPAAFLGAR